MGNRRVIVVGAGFAGLEVAQASDDKIYMWDAMGNAVAGFPYAFRGELRSLAAGDIDADGALEERERRRVVARVAHKNPAV